MLFCPPAPQDVNLGNRYYEEYRADDSNSKRSVSSRKVPNSTREDGTAILVFRNWVDDYTEDSNAGTSSALATSSISDLADVDVASPASQNREKADVLVEQRNGLLDRQSSGSTLEREMMQRLEILSRRIVELIPHTSSYEIDRLESFTEKLIETQERRRALLADLRAISSTL